MSAAFDTLKLSRRLETVGFSHEQATGMAEVLAEALDAELVTRDYLDSRLDALEGRADSRLAKTKTELKADIAGLDAKIDRLEGRVETEVARLEGTIETESAAIRGQLGRINWMLLLVIAAVALPWIEGIVAPLIGNSP